MAAARAMAEMVRNRRTFYSFRTTARSGEAARRCTATRLMTVSAMVLGVVVIVTIVVVELEPIQISDAEEIGSVIRHAGTLVLRNLRIGTKGSRSTGREILRDAKVEQSTAGNRRSRLGVGGDNSVRRGTFFNPRGD